MYMLCRMLKLLKTAAAGGCCPWAYPSANVLQAKANWDIIKEVKQAVSIPVIGNGDVFTPEDAKRMLDHTGCDAVMIGRAALGNPWMLYRTIEYLTNGTLPPDPTAAEKIRIAILHMDRLIALKGESYRCERNA